MRPLSHHPAFLIGGARGVVCRSPLRCVDTRAGVPLFSVGRLRVQRLSRLPLPVLW